MAERFEHKPQEYVSVVAPTVIYIGLADRAAFDKIEVPLKDHGENENGHVLVKSIESGAMMVIFQYWLKSRTIEALLADGAARRAKAELSVDRTEAQPQDGLS